MTSVSPAQPMPTTTPLEEPAPLSGRQLVLTHGDQLAVVTDVGAKVRVYRVGRRDVFTPFGEDEPAPAGHGAVLAPWPNRIRDGRYTWEGAEHQLDISEPALDTSLHGLVMWQRWTVEEHSESEVSLALRLSPSAGYPFDLLLRAHYRLDDAGLTVEVATTNLGTATAPYGVGFHPWLSPGPGGLETATVQLDADTRVLVDERLLPTGTAPAAGDYDLRSPRPMAGLDLDDAYLGVLRDADGLSWARLTGDDGMTAAVWMDGSMDAWQVCSGDHIAPVSYQRTGLAAEPMSCIADAFRTGDMLVHLEAGQTHAVRWGAVLLEG